MKYSQERKQAVLGRLAPPHQRTVKDVAAEEGISPATLYHWRQQARLTGDLFPNAGADTKWRELVGLLGEIFTAGGLVGPQSRRFLTAPAPSSGPGPRPGKSWLSLPSIATP